MLLIQNGRVIDPESNFDEICDILVKEDRIVKIQKDIENTKEMQVKLCRSTTVKTAVPSFIGTVMPTA